MVEPPGGRVCPPASAISPSDAMQRSCGLTRGCLFRKMEQTKEKQTLRWFRNKTNRKEAKQKKRKTDGWAGKKDNEVAEAGQI